MIFFSCTKENQNAENKYSYTLEITDSISITYPDTIPVFNATNSWSFNDTSFSHLTETENLFNIWVYRFESKDFKKISIDKYKIKVKGKYCIKNNMVYYFSGYTGEIFKINFQGEIEEKYNYDQEKYATNFKNNPWNFFESDETFIIPTSPVRSDMEYYTSFNLAFILNKKSNKIEKEILHFPKGYISKVGYKYSYLVGDFIFKNDTIIYSFKKSDYIYLYSISNKNGLKILAKNPQIDITKAPENLDPVLKAFDSWFKGEYDTLLFDHFKNVYYRISIAFPSLKNKDPKAIFSEENMEHIKNAGIINIQVFDYKLKLIANTNFSSKDVSITNYFINSNGLFLRSMYEPNENELVFKNLKLTKVAQ